MTPYLEPTPAAGADFFGRGLKGPVVMLNLLRLREVADYSAAPELAPEQPISGRYIAHTQPFLERSGGSLQFLGEGGGEAFQIRFEGDGLVYVQPSERNTIAGDV